MSPGDRLEGSGRGSPPLRTTLREFVDDGVLDEARILHVVSSTRPPREPLPPLDALQRLLLPAADAFMVAMLSRPPAGTLRSTRVTWLTIALSLTTVAMSAAAAAVVVRVAGHLVLVLIVALAALAALAGGAASLAVFGLRQRR